MLRFLILFVLLIAAGQPVWACSMSTENRATDLVPYVENGQICLQFPPPTLSFEAESERQFLEKVNAERETLGIAPLTVRAEMLPAARYHSLDMAINRFFSHATDNQRTHADRLSAFDRTLLAQGSAENIAQFGPATCYNQRQEAVPCSNVPGFEPVSADYVVDDLHQKLMESPGHRRNILDPEMTHIVIGVARQESAYFVTQVFAKHAGDLTTPAPLTIEAGDQLSLTASLPGWTVSNFALYVDDAPLDLEQGEIPEDMSGTYSLRVRGEILEEIKEGKRTRQIVTWIYPSGPAISIEPAKGS